MPVRAVLAGGLALVVVLAAVVLVGSGERSAGSNLVPESQEIVKLEGPGRHCQDGEAIPADAAALRLLVGTYGDPAPSVRVTATEDGRVVTSGRLAGGQREGVLRVPVRTVDDYTPGTRVCVSVSGPGRSVLYGSSGRLRLEWLRAGSESWFGLLPTISHRMSLARSDALGGLWLPAAALLLALAWFGAIRLVLRELGS